MFKTIESGNKEKRGFSPAERKHLGKYVYALIDPRDSKVFYVGQGVNDRLFSHFSDADKCLSEGTKVDSRLMRILDIWANDENVNWAIIAHRIESSGSVPDVIESAVMDAFSISQNGPVLNSISGPHSSLLLPTELEKVNAEPVNPDKPYQAVFLFWIHRALAEGRSPYDATRMSWVVSAHYRSIREAYAVGILEGVSIGSYRICEWREASDKRFFFNGEPCDDLIDKDWRNVIAPVRGFVQRGNYPVVGFDGNGKYRILRGNPDKGWRTISADDIR